MSNEIEKGEIGPSLDDFLKEQGLYEEVTETALRRALAFRLAAEMERQNMTKAEMVRRMAASRQQLERLLDPDNGDVPFGVLIRAAKAVGRTLQIELR